MPDYVLSVRAVEDLERIYDYTQREFGSAQAIGYLSELEQRFIQLANQPTLAPSVNDIRQGYRRSLYGEHAIYFIADGHDILIVRVLHQRMLPTLHLG